MVSVGAKVPTPKKALARVRAALGAARHSRRAWLYGGAAVVVAVVGIVIACNAVAPEGLHLPAAAPPPVLIPRVVTPGAIAPGADAAAPMWASAPTRLQIPSIAVDSGLEPLGLQTDGTMEVPASGFPAGWYTGAPTPGEMGPAIIAGHIDWNGPGVFFLLHTVVVGDEIDVTREDGSIAVFGVTEVGEYPKDAFPTALVYGDLDYAGLRLITCGGTFDKASGHYEVNVVVFATLVRSTPPTA